MHPRIGETTPPPEDDADIAEARAASDVNFEEARAASTTPTPARKKMATEENGLKPPQPTQPQQQKQPSTPSASPTGEGMKYVDDAVREAARHGPQQQRFDHLSTTSPEHEQS